MLEVILQERNPLNMTSQTITLNNIVELPILGLGTWQAVKNACVEAVAFALNHGYSLIDTAQAYNNEKEVGKGWQESGRQREDIFIKTKIHNNHQGYEPSKRSFETSLTHLQTDYVDLLLIHWPDISDFNRRLKPGGDG